VIGDNIQAVVDRTMLTWVRNIQQGKRKTPLCIMQLLFLPYGCWV